MMENLFKNFGDWWETGHVKQEVYDEFQEWCDSRGVEVDGDFVAHIKGLMEYAVNQAKLFSRERFVN